MRRPHELDECRQGLSVQGLSIRFGGILALQDVSFTLQPNNVLAVIGPNGAGKTTLLNCISRYYKPHSGKMLFWGKDLLAYQTHDLPKIGIARTFQHLELFSWLSVLDNLLVGQHVNGAGNVLTGSLPFPHVRSAEDRLLENAREVIRFLDLGEFEDWPVAALPYGIRKRVDLGRALVSRPKLLLLDEPAAGLTSHEMTELAEVVGSIKQRSQTSILLVEHHMPFVMSAADNVMVLDFGRKIAEGPPAVVREDAAVIGAYLGTVKQNESRTKPV